MKKNLFSVIAIIFFLLLTIGLSYAVFTYTKIGSIENIIKSGTVIINYTEQNELKIENAMPISDEAGKRLTGDNNVFTFSVQANITGNISIGYEIAAIKKDTNTLKDEEIKIYLEKNDKEILKPTHYIPIEEQTEIGSPAGSMVIDRGNFVKSTTNYYTMKMWVDENTEITEEVKYYTITVNVYAKDGEFAPYISKDGSNYPRLIEGMIPVIYNGKDWEVANLNKQWYQYEQQQWANAVTVNNDDLRSAKPGTIIPMNAITGMYVWIPRFSYTIKSENGGTNYFGRGIKEIGGTSPATKNLPGAIDVKFITSDITETGSAKYTGNTAQNYRTLPAFNYNGRNLDGVWMSKFEMSGTSNNIKFIPNATITVNYKVVDLYNMVYNQNNKNNSLGLLDNYEIKMIRSSDWDMAAILSQSIYGKYGNKNYTGANKEVYQNTTEITGKSCGSPSGTKASATYSYSSNYGIGASTTGTIYGIYDMNGGSYEYTMSVYKGENTTSAGFAKTWFTTASNKKYFDNYQGTGYSTNALNNGPVYGSYETQNWYNDSFTFVNSTNPWVARGGGSTGTSYLGNTAGIFRFGNISGAASSYGTHGTRAVIVYEEN